MTEAAIDHAGAEFSARLRLEAKDPADVNLARAYLASREELAISKSNAVGFSDQFDVANKRGSRMRDGEGAHVGRLQRAPFKVREVPADG